MAEDDEYDPNAGVAPWINVVVPVLSGLMFTLVLIWLYFTKWEIEADTLEYWAEKLPCWRPSIVESPSTRGSGSKRPVYKISTGRAHVLERSQCTQDNRGFLSDTGSNRSYGSTMSNGSMPYFYGSQCTMISYESQV